MAVDQGSQTGELRRGADIELGVGGVVPGNVNRAVPDIRATADILKLGGHGDICLGEDKAVHALSGSNRRVGSPVVRGVFKTSRHQSLAAVGRHGQYNGVSCLCTGFIGCYGSTCYGAIDCHAVSSLSRNYFLFCCGVFIAGGFDCYGIGAC